MMIIFYSIPQDVSCVFTLVTFGGAGMFYKPLVRTINNKVNSNDKRGIIETISQLQFDGPSNTDNTNREALDLISQNFYSSHGGAKQLVLFVTPSLRYMVSDV